MVNFPLHDELGDGSKILVSNFLYLMYPILIVGNVLKCDVPRYIFDRLYVAFNGKILAEFYMYDG